MSLDLAHSLLEQGRLDLDHLALCFAENYRWSCDYGPGAAKLLKRIRKGTTWHEANQSVFKGGSFGNGGAMRAAVIGLYNSNRPEEIAAAARDSARVTHAHELGMEGAVLIAASTAQALVSTNPLQILRAAARACQFRLYSDRLAIAYGWLQTGKSTDPKQVREELRNRIVALESCVTALYLALRFIDSPFEGLLAFTAACGGDVDTIGSMSGAIWGAANGAPRLPGRLLEELEQREYLVAVASALHEAAAAQ
ncbi:MAG: poly(ADP-ribose) glycohydrolase ARH3 [Candidatus Paceibacteria bacterium]|jgi:poly(ADP-ribose) glycohydrolase ARH3